MIMPESALYLGALVALILISGKIDSILRSARYRREGTPNCVGSV